MSTRTLSQQCGWKRRLVGFLLFGILAFGSATPMGARAQTSSDPWTLPQNLSHSGAATDPSIMIDFEGNVHVVWLDDFAKFVYTRFDGEQWSSPQPTDLHLLFDLPDLQEADDRSQEPHFSSPNPLFMAGSVLDIFAFWIDPEGSLYVRRVSKNEFTNVEAWGEAQLLSTSATSIDVDIDAHGELHLAFVRTSEDTGNPAGIYYLSSSEFGQNWGVPKLLYESPYLRGLVGSEANLSLNVAGAAEPPIVYVGWDNRPRKQVFFIKSPDGGMNWEQPVLIEGPVPESELETPYNIRVGATGSNAILVWQRGQPGSGCKQFYQFSTDEGITWSEVHPMLENLPGCAQANEFVAEMSESSEGLLSLLSKNQDQIFLSAWNGSQWSQPQAQQTLSGFENPEIYTQVDFGCQQAAIFQGRLYIVGCDQSGSGDIWITSREMASSMFSFSSSVWSEPAPVNNENLDIAAIEMVATQDNLIHACFSHPNDPAIYCTSAYGATWSRITQVLQLPEGEVSTLSFAAEPGDELLLVTVNDRGSLYISRANSRGAITASNWSTPARVQIDHDGLVSSADLALDAAGVIYISYTVPVNEERGIYLIQSKDQGKTWSSPVKVFNSEYLSFDLIGSPTLVVSDDRVVHIVWKNHSVQNDVIVQPLSLYYARSVDSGQTFDEPELIVDAPVAWRELIFDGDGNLHRLWKQADTMTILWDQVSLDGGESWEIPTQLTTEEGATAAARDKVGRLHLVSASPDVLRHWYWNEGRWQADTSSQWALDLHNERPTGLMAVTTSTDGKMIILFPVQTGEEEKNLLLNASRNLDLPTGQSQIQENPATPTLPTAIPTETRQEGLSEPTAVVDKESASIQVPVDRIADDDPMTPFAMALMPVGLLLVIVLFLVMINAARARFGRENGVNTIPRKHRG